MVEPRPWLAVGYPREIPSSFNFQKVRPAYLYSPDTEVPFDTSSRCRGLTPTDGTDLVILLVTVNPEDAQDANTGPRSGHPRLARGQPACTSAQMSPGGGQALGYILSPWGTTASPPAGTEAIGWKRSTRSRG